MTVRKPGWQPGVSCPNGAGNHKYTDAEKQAIENDPARKKAKELVEKSKRAEILTRKLDRKKAVLLKKEHYDVTPDVLEQITDVSEWITKEIELKCINGHDYTRTGLQLSRVKPNATICPICANSKRGKPKGNARLRYRMRADEQGFEVPPFDTLASGITMIHRTTKETMELLSFQIGNWRGAGQNRTVRFVADADNHMFIWLGLPPKVEHPFIAHLLETCEHTDYGDYGGLEGLKQSITECVSEGGKVVNLSHNVTWTDAETFNVYTWGALPMTDEMTQYQRDYAYTA